jgi:thiol peroxidase
MEDKRTGFMHGDAITLLGKELKVGDTAPDFTLRANDLSTRTLADYEGTLKLVSVVPSLDTGVCDAQTRRFNEEASAFDEDVTVLTVSMDLPFAQARWCGAAGIDRVITLSDHYDGNFGRSYGVLIDELRLLNRSIFILDKDNVVRYVQIVEENTNHPDYEDALKALGELRSR